MTMVKIINVVISMGYREISSVSRSWLLGNLGELAVSVNRLLTIAKKYNRASIPSLAIFHLL